MSTAVQQQVPTQFAPTQSQLAVAYSVCSSITRAAAKNFYYAFLVLPKPKRQALCAVYAFMRKCDDIADDVNLPPREKEQKLDVWLDSFHRALSGQPTDDPVLLALTDAQRNFNIQIGWLDQLAYGTAMDVRENDPSEATDIRTKRAISDVRRSAPVLLQGCVGGGTCLHSHLWISRPDSRTVSGTLWAGLSAHQYYS